MVENTDCPEYPEKNLFKYLLNKDCNNVVVQCGYYAVNLYIVCLACFYIMYL